MNTKQCSRKGLQKVFLLNQNKVASCCRAYPETLPNNADISVLVDNWQQEYIALAAGEQLPGCNVCWKDENSGQISYRQQLLESNKPEPNSIEIFVSNLCNQMCSYCSPKFSSKWENSIASLGTFANISNSARQNLQVLPQQTVNNDWMQEIKHYVSTCENDSVVLRLLGGEPLMQIHALEQLLTFDIKKLSSIVITTNLNPPSNRFLTQVLDTFPATKLRFAISLDSMPKHNHVPRAGFDLLRFEQNLELLQSQKIKFKFLSTVSVLNIFDLWEFAEWGSKNQFEIEYYLINNPECLHPGTLPKHIRKQILTTLQDHMLPNIVVKMLQNPDSDVDLLLFEQYNYLKQYFDRTGIDPKKETIGNYWNWLEQAVNNNFKL